MYVRGLESLATAIIMLWLCNVNSLVQLHAPTVDEAMES